MVPSRPSPAALPSDVYSGDPLTVVAKLAKRSEGRAHAHWPHRRWDVDSSARARHGRRSGGHCEAMGSRAHRRTDAARRIMGGDATEAEGADRESRARPSPRQRLHQPRRGRRDAGETGRCRLHLRAGADLRPARRRLGSELDGICADCNTPAPLLMMLGLLARGGADADSFAGSIHSARRFPSGRDPCFTRGSVRDSKASHCRRPSRLIGAGCIVGACWIHVKAFAAQVLINSAVGSRPKRRDGRAPLAVGGHHARCPSDVPRLEDPRRARRLQRQKPRIRAEPRRGERAALASPATASSLLIAIRTSASWSMRDSAIAFGWSGLTGRSCSSP